jgi:hypothetical protein
MVQRAPQAIGSLIPRDLCDGIAPAKVGFAIDSPLEGDGFEPSVPRPESLVRLAARDATMPHREARNADRSRRRARASDFRMPGAPLPWRQRPASARDRLRRLRQAAESRIIVNAHRANQGLMPDLAFVESGDFYFVDAADPEDGARKLLAVVRERIPKRFGSIRSATSRCCVR